MTPPALPAPWPHQTGALDFVRDKQGAMLAMDMGTGKSRVATDLALDRNYQRILILAPLSVAAHVWPEQIKRFGRRRDGSWWILPYPLTRGSVRTKRHEAEDIMEQFPKRPVALIVNYESAWRNPLSMWLLNQKWDLLVMDESHRLKAPGSKVSRFCSRLSDRIPHRLALTGTPMPHSPLDIYAQYRALDKRVFGTNYQKFKSYFAITGGFGGYQVVGYQNHDVLESRFRRIAYQVTASEVLDLPPTQDIYHTIEMGGSAQRVYQDMERDFLADLENGQVTIAANALVRITRLQQITSGFAGAEDGQTVPVDDAKSKHLEDLLDGTGRGEPVVVFARFIHDLDRVRQASERTGREYREMSGRRKQISEWQVSGGVIGVQLQSGGVGLDMSAARIAIYYSMSHSLGDYMQSRARLHRPGQTRPVAYYHLMIADSIDQNIVRALRRKEDVVEKILKTRTLERKLWSEE